MWKELYYRVEMIKETINDPMLSFSAAGIMTFILRVFVFLPDTFSMNDLFE